jgi:hypothetical protein
MSSIYSPSDYAEEPQLALFKGQLDPSKGVSADGLAAFKRPSDTIDGGFLQLLAEYEKQLAAHNARSYEAELLLSRYRASNSAERDAMKSDLSTKLGALVVSRDQVAAYHGRILQNFLDTAPRAVNPEVQPITTIVCGDMRLLIRHTATQRFGIKSVITRELDGRIQLLDVFQHYPIITVPLSEMASILVRLGRGESITLKDVQGEDSYTLSSLPTEPGKGYELNGLKMRLYNDNGKAVYMWKNGFFRSESSEVQILLDLLVAHIESGARARSLSFADSVTAGRLGKFETPAAKRAYVEQHLLKITKDGTSSHFVVMTDKTTRNIGAYDLSKGPRAVFLGTSQNLQFTPPVAPLVNSGTGKPYTPLFETVRSLKEAELIDAADSFVLTARNSSGAACTVKFTSCEHNLAYELTERGKNAKEREILFHLVAYGCKEDFRGGSINLLMGIADLGARLQKLVDCFDPSIAKELHALKNRVLALGDPSSPARKAVSDFIRNNFTAIKAASSMLCDDKTAHLEGSTGALCGIDAKTAKMFISTFGKFAKFEQAVKAFEAMTPEIRNSPTIEFHKRNKKSLLAKFVELVAAYDAQKASAGTSVPVPTPAAAAASGGARGGAGAPSSPTAAASGGATGKKTGGKGDIAPCRNGASCKFAKTGTCKYAH